MPTTTARAAGRWVASGWARWDGERARAAMGEAMGLTAETGPYGRANGTLGGSRRES